MSTPTSDNQSHHPTSVVSTAHGHSPIENSGKLKVEDALKYIDRVKGRFNEEIYKKFLEVMKDFKAQKINTESVIQNVLSLFHGNQDLIEGFNTFLPPGYQMSSYQNDISPTSGLSANTLSITNNQPYSVYTNPISKGQIEMPIIHDLPHDNIYTKEKIDIAQTPIIQSSGNSQFSIKPMSSGQGQQTPSEFNHAVEYVNKIKNRFQKQPDIYKRFLEILHWYQKEQKNPDLTKRKQTENEVSQEVAKLFDNEHDLLQEFSTFLPDSGSFGNNLVENEVIPGRRSSSGFKTVGTSSQTYCINVATPPNILNINEKSKFPNITSTKIDIMSESNEKDLSEYYRPVSSSVALTTGALSQTQKRNLVQDINNDRRISNVPPSKRSRNSSSTISIKDSTKLNLTNNPELCKYPFFNIIHAMIKELLDLPHESSYYSFINTINLFNQQVIGVEQLKAAVKPLFSKKSETWYNFLKLIDKLSENERIYSDEANFNIGYAEDAGRVNSPNYISNAKDCNAKLIINSNITNNLGNIPGSVTTCQTVFWKRNLELSKLQICGSHYRVLPEEFTEARSAIQLKNKLCKEVLNYNFLCHRSLAAEDAPFVFSKKNAYEESVFKLEDERYEIDMVMEVNKAAMVRLADLQIRLTEMTVEQMKNFNFEENLYKSSTILFYKAVQRIYGDKAPEIINGLKNHPSVVVPIVLGRMKEKDSEWKEKIKLFRRHWRNQDQNVLKSLDYQAIHFRVKDFSMMRNKTIISQLDSVVKNKVLYLTDYQDKVSLTTLIESLLSIKRTWKLDKPDKWGSNAYGNGGVIEYNDKVVPSPLYHLLLLFPCDSQYAKSILDYPFQPKMYLFDRLDWHSLLTDASSLILHHLKRQTNFTKDDKTSMKVLMRVALQDILIDDRFQMSDDEDDSIEATNVDSEKSGISNKSIVDKDKNYRFFLGNKQWYIFIRLYHVLIDRLAALKIKGEQLHSKYKEEKKQNTLEVADLLLYKKSGQHNPADYYEKAIHLVEDLLDSCEDTSNFEDKMREMYDIHAYIWFSMDKLISTLVRQLQMISCTDSLSRKLTSLFCQCSKPFFGKDEQNNTLRITLSGTGTRVDSRTEEIINDEYEYMQAASRLSLHYKQPLVVMLFHRNPLIKYCGHMSISLLDIPPLNSSDSESQDENTPTKDESISSNPGMSNYGRVIDINRITSVDLTWRHYLEGYVKCSEKLGFAEGLHNLSLDKRIAVPVFLLRSLRRNINILSKQSSKSEVSESFIEEEDQTSSPRVEWHGVIVKLISNIFLKIDEDSLHKFLKNTIMTGHMCPMAEEGHNLMMKYAATKLTWSVGSCGIFCRIKRNSSDQKIQSKKVNNIRRYRFRNFQNLWIKGQSKD